MIIRLIFFLFFTSFLYATTLPLLFQGNDSISERELYSALALEKPYFYEFWKESPSVDVKSINLLVQTTKNYYKSKGFFNSIVNYKENNTSISIIIKEDVPIIISNLTVISQLNIASKIPFVIGDIFDAQMFTQSKKNIKLFYTNNSYCNAELNAKAWIDVNTNLAYLNYDITPNALCHVSVINITSSPNIDKPIIKSLLYLRENDLYSTQKLSDSYVNLYGYEGISKATITTDIDNNNSVSINVKISENEKPVRFEAGLGASSDEGFMVSLGIKHRNIFGNLKTMSAETTLTQIKQTLKTSFDMPLTHSNATGATIGFENEEFIGYKESRSFASVYLKQRNVPHLFRESLILDNSKTYESSDTVLFPEGQLFIISPKIEWDYDTRDKILDPKQGYFLHAELMGSVLSALSDASYHKLKLSGGYILPLSTNTLAMRASFGSINLYDGDIPASYRFYAGGMNSNRAYSYNKLGPVNSDGDPVGFDSIFETTLEYRFTIYGEFRGVIFNDSTFIGSGDIPNTDGYYTAGFGLRYMTPIGPLAIDLGFDLSDPSSNYALHFRVGELF